MTVRDIDDFANWLTDCGAEVLSPTSEWEILRVRTSTGIHVVHRNRKGVESWPTGLLTIAKSYRAGQFLALAATRRKRKKSKTHQEYGALALRDGTDCFYCGTVVAPPEAPVPYDFTCTVEHLVSVAHGGPDHLSNKFLAHLKCNQIAGNRSAPEKIRLREEMRGANHGG